VIKRDIAPAEAPVALSRRRMNSIRVVSDLICPWCYVGKRRLETALGQLPPQTPVSVSWHPFQLNPDIPVLGMDRGEYLLQKFGSSQRCEELEARMAGVGRSVGIDFRFDLQSNIPNTFDVHRVIWLAGKLGAQNAVVEALFRAYFCEGANLSAREDLIEVASSTGLDIPRLERLLSSDEGAAEVKSEEREIKNLGVSAVPLFIMRERVGVSGAQPPETLLQAFEDAKRYRKHARECR
jgi:predicted DsbA family dithiol-disulfide isomerase